MGLYKNAGIDVEFETGRGSAASAQKVGAGASQLGLSDMAGVLLFRGKGARSRRPDERLRQLAAGHLLAQELAASTGVKDLAGKKIGNPAGDGARTMWPALAKTDGIDPNSVTWVNIDANAKLSALKAKTDRRHDVVLQSAPRVRPRTRRGHGLPGVEGCRREPLRQFDHRQRPVAESQQGQGGEVRQDHAEGVRRLRQERRNPASMRWSKRMARCTSTTNSTTGISSPC